MYGIQFDDVPVRFGSFPFYSTREEAETVAAMYRNYWIFHTYKVVGVIWAKQHDAAALSGLRATRQGGR